MLVTKELVSLANQNFPKRAVNQFNSALHGSLRGLTLSGQTIEVTFRTAVFGTFT